MKPWVIAMLAAGTVILCIYAYLGMRYWQTSVELARTAEAMTSVRYTVSGVSMSYDELTAMMTQQEAAIVQLKGVFHDGGQDPLMAHVTESVRRSGLEIVSLTAGKRRPEDIDGVVYNAQPMLLVTHGEAAQLPRFFALLHEAAPMARVVDVRATGVDALPMVHVDLLFYLSPGATAGTPQQ